MQELHDLELLLRSRTPLLVIETQEEPRIVQLFVSLAIKLGQAAWQWSITEGLQRLEISTPPVEDSREPESALRFIKASPQAGIFLLLDIHPFLDAPVNVRLMKEIVQQGEPGRRTLVLVSHALDLPAELKPMSARFELHLPDRAGLAALINEEAKSWEQRHGARVKASRSAIKQLSDNLLGMTAQDAKRLIRHAIEQDGAITSADLPEVARAKYRLLGGDGLISFEHDTAGFSDIAGLSNLKQWVEHRRAAMQTSQRGADRPKGILLLGIQGGGKSLAAKAVAGFFGIPLLRLDFAVLYNKYIGETEKNLRKALQTAEAMSPCVIWMDEIEKGVAQGDDDGVSRRVLGTLLTWMAEHGSRVFIVATANDIQSLPPELMRKGRMDEIFFVDLPDRATRQAIFNIHLRQRNLAPSGFDLDNLADASEGFSGAEIEQAVVSALFAARSRDTGLSDELLLQELARTQPLSVVMAEHIDDLRAWAKERTVPA